MVAVIVPKRLIFFDNEPLITVPSGPLCSARLLRTEIGHLQHVHLELKSESRQNALAAEFLKRLAPNPEGVLLHSLAADSHFLDSLMIRTLSLISEMRPIRRVADLMSYDHRQLKQRCFQLLSAEYAGKTRVNCAGAFADSCRQFLSQYDLPLGVQWTDEQRAVVARVRPLRWGEFEKHLKGACSVEHSDQ